MQLAAEDAQRRGEPTRTARLHTWRCVAGHGRVARSTRLAMAAIALRRHGVRVAAVE
jgi:hypothetical protein